MKKSIWLVFAALCILVGFYPSIYFLIDERFGLLNTKSDELLADYFWRIGFYTHIVFGGVALLVGWSQFSRKWRMERPVLHRRIGKIYVLTVLLSALAGIFVGLDATGGLAAKTGFVSLGVIWFFTTLLAYIAIRKGQVLRHQKLMIYSYAGCFAAVTLRIWLPMLIALHKGDFEPAYRIVAWLSWVPNLVVAWWLVQRLGHGSSATA
ncbi:MAG: DUF2306 domain-containing protein [Saprospiraceae bacterium]|jgi:uncharacterized membrane protein|nr:DUF2306 domain-containing protein [Saprospiraceae bacterium]